MSRLTRTLLAALILATLIAGSAAAQDPNPATIVQQFVDEGMLSEFGGALDATDRGETIDLTGFDNRTSWKRGLGRTMYTNVVIGGTISWQTGAANDTCGFVLRQPDDRNYMMVSISQNQMLRFTPVIDDRVADDRAIIVDAIRMSDDDTNDLAVMAAGSTIAVMVNGEIVDTFTDPVVNEGRVGEAMTTYGWADVTQCRFDNVWLWDLSSAATSPQASEEPADSAPDVAAAPTATPAHGKPATDPPVLQHYNAPVSEAVAELEALGIIPSGGHEIFREPQAFFEGTGAWFTPLASYKPFTHIVMAGELDFTPSDSGELETCTLMARTVTQGNTATSYLEVGIAGADMLIIVDINDHDLGALENEVVFGMANQPQHILFTALRNEVNVWLNGELILENVLVTERSGTYGISLMAEGPNARCEGSNIWAWEVDDVVAFGDLCGVRAANTVNLRGGPGTHFDIIETMGANQTAIVMGQATAADGFVWYLLDNDAWVRSDVITVGGDCTAVPEIDG